ncbi:MAG: nitroreductase family protein [Ruminococcus sp.]|nr:nitroreductase family protein [Ruminococcus sp.]
MNLNDGLKGRRSIRKYKIDKVDTKLIEKVIDTARFAPTWKNSQTARYNIVTDETLKAKIADEATCGFEKNKNIIKNAPVLVVLSTVDKISGFNTDGSYTTTKGEHWQSFDAGISAEIFCLSAFDNGLGTLIMGIFDEDKVAELINLPNTEKVSALIALGYPDDEPMTPKRKEVSEIIRFI